MNLTPEQIGKGNLFDTLPKFADYVSSLETDSSTLPLDDAIMYLECLVYHFFPKAKVGMWECMVIHERGVGCYNMDIEFEEEDYEEEKIMEIFKPGDFTKDWTRDKKGKRDVWSLENYKGKERDGKNLHHWILDRLIQKYRNR